jgi:hypothetical protein
MCSEKLNIRLLVTGAQALVDQKYKQSAVKVQQVHDFIQNHLYHASSAPAKIRRRALVRQRPHLKVLTEDIKTVRSRLVDFMTVSNLYVSHS